MTSGKANPAVADFGTGAGFGRRAAGGAGAARAAVDAAGEGASFA